MIAGPPIEGRVSVLMAEDAAVIRFLCHAVVAAVEHQVAPAAEQYARSAAAGGHAELGIGLPFQSDGLGAGSASAERQVVIPGTVEGGDHAAQVHSGSGTDQCRPAAPISGVIE